MLDLPSRAETITDDEQHDNDNGDDADNDADIDGDNDVDNLFDIFCTRRLSDPSRLYPSLVPRHYENVVRTPCTIAHLPLLGLPGQPRRCTLAYRSKRLSFFGSFTSH